MVSTPLPAVQWSNGAYTVAVPQLAYGQYLATSFGSSIWDGSSSHDVAPSINAAIAQADLGNGGIVLIPPGVYYIATPIINNNHQVTVMGLPGIGPYTATELIWNGAAGGTMASATATTGQLNAVSFCNLRFNGNSGLAANGLALYSVFGGHFDDLTFIGGFNGGNILLLSVINATANSAQNNTFNNLYIDNGTPGSFTSNQFKLSGFIDGSGMHGNASYNRISNVFIGGIAPTTGILIQGGDNNIFDTVRIFNSNVSVDLSILQSGSKYFGANGNIFNHIQATGSLISRGTTSFPGASAVAPLTVAYNNEFISVDDTNASVHPTYETGAQVQWSSNSGYKEGYAFVGVSGSSPGFIAVEDYSIWNQARVNAITNAADKVSGYIANSEGGALLEFDSITGDRYIIKFPGSGGTSNIQFKRAAGTGTYEFVETLQIDAGILPSNDLTQNFGTTSKRLAALSTKAISNNNGSNNWIIDLGVGSGASDGNITMVHNGTTVLTLYADGGITIGAPTGASKGAGTLNVATGLYVNNVAVTVP